MSSPISITVCKGRCKVGPVVAQHGSLCSHLRLAQRRRHVGPEVVIKTPAQNLLPDSRNLRIQVRLDDLRQDRFVLHDLKRILDKRALRVANPAARTFALQHQRAVFVSCRQKRSSFTSGSRLNMVPIASELNAGRPDSIS